MDTILGIPPGESYSGIHALVDLSVCVNKYQHSLIVVPEPGHYYIGLRALDNVLTLALTRFTKIRITSLDGSRRKT